MEIKCKNGCDKPVRAKGLCRNCYEKMLKETNPDYKKKQSENCKRWHKNKANKDKISNWGKRYRENNTISRTNTVMRSRLSISLEDYEAMLERQGGRCGICGKHISEQKKRFHVDHDHNTGEIRGLLCFRCNFGLGWFQDDKNKIAAALEHLNGKNSYKRVEIKNRESSSKAIHVGYPTKEKENVTGKTPRQTAEF